MRNVLGRRPVRAGLAGGLLGGVVVAVPAAAAGSCAMSGSTVTCTYSAVGTDTFTVPTGVGQVTVDALGAQGGTANDGTAGGYGGEAVATIPVAGGQGLQVNVGGQPVPGNPAAGGFNGGGAGGAGGFGQGGGGGGGASDVRQGGTDLASRVVVAGGGGGGSGLVPSGGTMTNGVRAGSGQVTISYAYLPAQITEAFGASSIPFGGSTSLTFTIANPNIDASLQLTGIGFTDTLPPGLVVATPDNGLSGGCGGGTITAAPASPAISLSGATLGASQNCTFSVNVIGTRPGAYTNTTGPVTWDNGGTGNTASASLTVDGCPAAMPNAHLLTATTNAGTILGGFCVSVLGTGTYRQGTVSGTGVAEDLLGVTTVLAHGTNLDLSGTGLVGVSTFSEQAPVSAAGTFTLGG